MPALEAPLRAVVGDKTAKALAAELDLDTVGDLLYHYPRRYDERGEHTDISKLEVGEQVTVAAKVQRVNVRPMRQRRGKLLEVTVGDGRESLTLTFFNQAWRERELTRRPLGPVRRQGDRVPGSAQLNGPQYQLLAEPGTEAAEESRGVRRRADPGLPGRERAADLDDRPVRPGRAGHARAAAGSAAGGPARAYATWSTSARRCARSTGRRPGRP